MSECSQNNLRLLHRYHDGELDSADRRQVEQHLSECAECRGQLNELRALSGRLVEVRLDPITSDEQDRLHQAISAVTSGFTDHAIIRMAFSMAAIAASLLIVTSVWLVTSMQGRSDASGAGGSPQDWQQVAMTLHSDSHLPDWMVHSLGGDLP
jgi:anti-sigma factor RsiW